MPNERSRQPATGVTAQPAFNVTQPSRTEGKGLDPVEVALTRAKP